MRGNRLKLVLVGMAVAASVSLAYWYFSPGADVVRLLTAAPEDVRFPISAPVMVFTDANKLRMYAGGLAATIERSVDFSREEVVRINPAEFAAPPGPLARQVRLGGALVIFEVNATETEADHSAAATWIAVPRGTSVLLSPSGRTTLLDAAFLLLLALPLWLTFRAIRGTRNPGKALIQSPATFAAA